MMKQRTPKICFSLIRAIKKLTRIAKINFLRALQVNHRLAQIQGEFVQEKMLNFHKNN